jgi:hypothetical protein
MIAALKTILSSKEATTAIILIAVTLVVAIWYELDSRKPIGKKAKRK